MTANSDRQTPEQRETLGELIERARVDAGFTYKQLAERSGVAQSQISKLAHDQVRKANPAHLAALAEPLGLTIYQLYSAAGYGTPATLTHLGAELEEKLRALPPDAVARLEQYIETLTAERYDVDQATN